jgi:hypothetical protein
LLESAATEDWWHLVRYGPRGLAAYVRVAFESPALEASEADPALRMALALLARHTTTPQHAYAAIWEGWTIGGATPRAPGVAIPNRSMLLFEGPVGALRDAPQSAWYGAATPVGPAPHLAWPRDRAWCLACDVDEELEFSVGCSVAAAEDLALALPGAVRRVGYGAEAPLWRDES